MPDYMWCNCQTAVHGPGCTEYELSGQRFADEMEAANQRAAAEHARTEEVRRAGRTTEQWWTETKADPERLAHWLRRQYVGEMAAVNLLSELLITYGGQASSSEWDKVHKVMCQEATHAKWMKRLMEGRGIDPEVGATAERRYWSEVKPAVTSFQDGCAAGYHAERMRLERIRRIAAETDPEFSDLAETFSKILPHEMWHERVFDEMRQGRTLSQYHERGLEKLNLLMS